MGDSDDSNSKLSTPIDIVFSVHSIPSSVDPPMEQWSSLEIVVPEDNKKKILCDAGLYDPGSGIICAKYIAMSHSSIFRHPYYNYPALMDPGIKDALFNPKEHITFPPDGQASYLVTCKEMNQCPVKSFYRGLLKRKIDLKYYSINPNGFRAMAKALQYNITVEELNLTDNFLNDDACYHMGDMLLTNKTITEINLRGCRIGPEGVRRLFYNLPLNRTLTVIDLSHNQLGDDGMQHIAKAIIFGIPVKQLYLSYNNISGKGVMDLAESFETHNNFTHLDLSWNKLYTLGGHQFLTKLSESTCLEVLNLSWNSLSGPRMGLAISEVLLCPVLSELNLSNNQLQGEAITTIASNLMHSKKLDSLNLSHNPLSTHDAITVLHQVALKSTKLKNLIMENVYVNRAFLSLLAHTKQKKSKGNLVVTYGAVVGTFEAKGPDAREVVLNRVQYLTMSHRSKADIALIVLQLQKDNRIIMDVKDFTGALESSELFLNEDLITELCNIFPATPKKAKQKIININLLAEYIKRKWPDKKLPLTPPPEPEPEPIINEPPKKKKEKGKKKVKN